MNPFQNIERFDLRVLYIKANYFLRLNIIHPLLCIILGLLYLLSPNRSFGQACDASTPSFTANLTGQPNGVYISPTVSRNGNCCGTSSPDRCIEFWITLDPNAQGINFAIASGAIPTGAMYYQIGCGPIIPVGQPVCLNGVGPHRLTFCKPGNNQNTYSITSIGKPSVSGNVTVSDGCKSTIIASNFILSTITWQSISPGTPGQYNSYLSFPHNKDTAIATYAPGAPATVTYKVCGTPVGGCTNSTVCLTANVNFVTTLGVVINPNNPTICFGGSSTPLTANVTGGSGPYTYSWTRNGANVGNTQVINASTTGTYIVTVADATSCPTATNSVVVTAFSSPITANSGPPVTSCANNPSVVLNGVVQQATGGIWSGGSGTYSPSKSSLVVTYTPTAAEIAAGTVTHTLTTTGNGTCPAASDPVVMTIAKTPIVSAGPNQTVCANNANVNLAGSVTYAGGGRWSGGAGTFIPNDSTLNAVYKPTAAEITAGVVNLKLTSIQNGSCLPVSSTVQIIITPAPTVNAGPDQSVCANSPTLNIIGTATNATSTTWSGGFGIYSPNNSSLNLTYTVAAVGIAAGSVTLTLTADKSTCLPVSDQMVITITPAPTVDAGSDQTVCANNSVVTLAGSETIATGGTWSGGTGTFSPNSNSLNATYTPSATETSNGFVTLTLTSTGNGKCTAVSDQMTITMTPAPVVNAGSDQTVCGNNETTQLSGNVSIASGGIWSGGSGTFSPNKTDLNASYTPTAAEILAGGVDLTLTSTGNGSCLPATDQIHITITPAPTVNAGTDLSICENNAIAQLSGTVTIASGGTWSGGNGTFQPDNTTLNAQYIPTAAEIANGIIHLTLISTGNGNCIPVSDNMVITITPAPTADAGSDQTVCGSSSTVALNGAVTISSGGLWTTSGTGIFSPSATTLNASYIASPADIASTSVTLTLTSKGNGNCIAVTDQMIISFSSVPLADAGPDTTACTNDFPIHLSANGTAGAWVGGTGTFSPSRTVLNPTYTPSASEISAGTITLTYKTNAIGSCPSISDNVTISILPGPVVNSGGNMTVCANKTPIALSGSVSNAGGGVWTSNGTGTFSPSANDVNASYFPSAADTTNGTITLKLTSTNNGGCTAETDLLVINFTHAPTVSAGSDQTYCADITSVPISGSKTLATGVIWSGGAGSFSPSNTSLNATYTPTASEKNAGSLKLILSTTGNGTCNAEKDTVVLTFTPAPTANAGADQTICADSSGLNLYGSVTIASGGMWTSSGSGTFTPNAFALNAIYVPSSADTLAHSVQLTLTTTGNGTCIPVSDVMNIAIQPIPVVNAGIDKTYCSDIVNATLSGAVKYATGGIWSSTGTGSFSPNNTKLNANYVPSTADKTSGSIILTLTSSGNGSCKVVTDQVILYFTPAPTINAGLDETVCATSPTVTLNATVTIASGGKWTTSGSGNFSNANSLNPTYTASNGDIAANSVTLTITSTGNGTCNPVSDNLVLTIQPKPVANAGPNITVCGDVVSINLNGSVTNATGGDWSGGAGTYSPNSSTLNAVYYPNAAERSGSTVKLTLTTTGNGSCFADHDRMNLIITPVPTVDAGSDQIVCADVGSIAISGAVTVATGGKWTSSGTGTFGNANGLSTSYTPSALDISNGTVVLTLTTTGNGTCIPVSDQITITITPAPTISAGPNQSICADQGSVLLSGSVTVATGAVWTTSGSGTFLPDNTTLNASYYPSAADTSAGTVTLTLTSTGNGTCIPVLDKMTINIVPSPVVNAGPDRTYCSDILNAPLSGSIQHAAGGQWTTSGTGTFSPNNTTLNATYIPSAADKTSGSIILVLTSTGNGLCNLVFDQVILNFTPAPTIDAGTDQTVCAATPPLTLNGSVTIATGGTWTTSGSGTFSDPNLLNSTYTPSGADTLAHSVTLTITSTGNGTCIPVKDNLVINFTPSPIVNAGPGQAVCESVTSINLNGTVKNAAGGAWTTTGSGTFGNANALSTTYAPTDSDRTAGSVNLILTSIGNGLCSAVSDTAIISFNDLPSVNAIFDTLCTNLSGVNLNSTVTLASGVKWTTSGTGTFTPSANSFTTKYMPSATDKGKTIYLYVTATGTGACAPPTDTIRLSVQQDPIVDAGPDQSICIINNTVTLNGKITNASGGTWTSLGGGSFNPNVGTLNPVYTTSTADTIVKNATLILTSIPNGFCPAVRDTMNVTINPVPIVTGGASYTICADSSGIKLNGSIASATGGIWTSSGSGSFLPNDSTLNAVYVPSPADTSAHSVKLTLTSTGNGACIAVKKDVTLNISPAPRINVGPDQIICADLNVVNLNASITVATGVNWTTTGTGTFNSASANPAQYTTSNTDTTSGTVKFIGTTTGNGTCKAVTDTLILTITPAPTISASAPTTCADSDSIQLTGKVTVATGAIWTTSGTGTFVPNNTTLNAKYVTSSADKTAGLVNLLLTSTGNGTCKPVSAPVTLTIIPAPIANAGPDKTVCADAGSVTLSSSVANAGGGIWSTLGTGTFAPSNTSLNGLYNLSNADTTAHAVTLVLTTTGNGLCKTVTDTVIVTVVPAPVVNAGFDQPVCGDASSIQVNGSVFNAGGGTWTSSGTGTFDNANILNPTYQFTAADTTAGSVTLTLSSTGNGTCKAVSDQMVITITDAPRVSAGSNQTICADASGVKLNGSVTVASGVIWTSSGSGTFTPNANTLNATYVPSTADIAANNVKLTLTTIGNGTCKPVKDSIIITITPAPTINVGPNQTICADLNSVNLNSTITIATGITWTTSGTGSFSSANAPSTSYSVSNTDTTSGLVTFIGTSTGNGTCKAVSDTLTLTITPTPTIVASAPTTCADSDTIQLSGKITIATGAIWTTSGTGTFVPNNTTLNAKYVSSSADKAGGTVNLLLTSTGNGTCKSVSAPVNLTITPAPISNAGPDKTVCADIGSISLAGSVTNAGGGVWTSLGTGSFINNTSLNGAYNLSVADTTAHKVTFVLATSGNGLCKAVTDTMVVTVVPAPVVNAGFDQPVCGDAGSIQVNGTVYNANSGNWTSSGTGTFSEANSLSPTYQFTAADTTAGTVTLTLTSTGNGTCNAVSDQVVITITDAPKVNAGSNQTICADASGVSLNGSVTVSSGVVWASTGTGTFSPNINTQNATYIPSVADIASGSVQLTLTTIGNGTCKPVKDSIVITITPAPTINVGPDQIICADLNLVNLNASITVATGVNWTTTGTGAFNSVSANPTQYTITSADTTSGSVIFIGTTTGNGTCKAVKDTLTLIITPAPTISSSAPTTCADSDTIQLSGSVTVATGAVWTTSGTGTFIPNNTTLNAKYVASASDITAGTANLLLTSTGNGTCKPVSVQVALNIIPAPVANAGSDRTVCADIGTVNLSGSVINAGGGAWSTLGTGTFTPSNTALNSSYILTNSDTTSHKVTLVLTTTGNGLCKAITDTMFVTIIPAPVVNAGFDQPVCGDANSIQVNGTVINAGGATWTSSGTGSFSNANSLSSTYQFTPSDTTAGSVTLTLTSTGNGTCNAVNDQVVITITDAPRVNAGSNQTICADVSSVSLNGSVTVASGVVWTSTGSGNFTPDANTLNATYVPSVTDITSGNIQLTLTTIGNGSCKPVKDSVIITITPAPTINVGPDQTICADATTVNLNAATTIATGVNWTTTGTGTFSNLSSNPTQYTISNSDTTSGIVKFIGTTTGNGSCKAVIDTLTLSITPTPTISASAPTTCADSDTIELSGRVTVATGAIWTTSGSGTFVPNSSTINAKYVVSSADKAAGTVNLLLTSTGNGTCKPVSMSVPLNILPAPIANAGPNQTVCADAGTVNLFGSVVNAGGGVWNTLGTGTFASSTNNLNATYNLSNADTASHSVTLVLSTTSNGLCKTVTDTVVVTVVPAPIVNAGFDQPVCGDAGSIQVNGTVFNAGGGTWSSSGTGIFDNATILNPNYNFSSADTSAGSVTLTLSSTDNGTCKAVSDQVIITFTDAPQVSSGPDKIICADASGVSLNGYVTVASGVMWTSSGSGTLTPDATTLNVTYVPSTSDTAAHSVQLTLTTIGNGTCKAVKDSIVITITPAPTINVGPNQTICADLTTVNLNAVTTVATGVNWTTTGTGSFSNANALSTSYSVSKFDTTSGTVRFVGATTGNGTCNAVTDTLSLIITPAPTITASAGSSCADSDTIQLSGSVTVATGARWTTSGSGVFVPNDLTLNAKYVTSSADKAAGTVNLLLTSTGNGTCKPISVPVTLLISPAPIANAGPDQTVCADIGTVSLSGVVTNAGGGTWSTLGTGTFSPSISTLNGTYNISNADTTAHTIILVLTTTGNGLCNAVTDTMKINITPAPLVNAGFDQPICGDANNIQLNGTVFNAGGGTWTSSGTGSFSNVNSLNPTYNITPSDTTAGSVTLTLTSTGNGTCKSVNDQMIITITDAPIISAGPDQTICADASGVSLNGSVTVASGVVWTSSGTGIFVPNANALNATYVPSAADTAAHNVLLTLTTLGTGTCKPVSDQMTVFITPAPTINIGPDATICGDVTTYNLNAIITVASGINWTATGAGSFSSITTLSTVYTIDTDKTIGIIKFVGTTTGNGTCNAVSDTLSLTITTVPTVNAGPDITICSDSTLLQISGNTTVASGIVWTTNGSGSFVPNANTLTAYYKPSGADIINGGANIKITTTGNGTCLPVSDSLRITLTPAPTVNAGPDQTICANSSGASLNGVITVATGASWTSSGSGTFSPDASSITSTYIPSSADTSAKNMTLVLTTTGNGTCKPRKDTLILSIDPLPIVHSGANKLCSDKDGIVLNGKVANATGAVWTTSGSGTFTPNATNLNSRYIPSTGDIQGEVVKLTLSSFGNGTCNADSSSLNLVTVFKKPIADAGPDQRICIHASTTLYGTQVSHGSYTWYTENNLPIGKSPNLNVTANSDTSFVFAVTDTSGCVVTDTMSVFVVDSVKFQLDPHYCFERGLILDANPQPGIPTVGTFNWYRNDTILVGENTSTLQVQKTGKHLISYSYGTCNYDDSTVITPLPNPKGSDKYTCPGATTLVSTSPVGINYQWNINNKVIVQDSNSINVNASNTPGASNAYIVTVTDKLGCKNNDTINVIAIPPPDLHVDNASGCLGQKVTLTANVSNINSMQYGLQPQYVWERNYQYLPDTLSSITVTQAGIYSVRLNIGECYAYDTAKVSYHNYPVPSNESNYTFCSDEGGSVTLDAGPGYAYNWLNVTAGISNTNRTVSVNAPGTYYVMISNEFNCSVKDSMIVDEKCAPQVFTAASFTPGVQGGNSHYFIKGNHFANFEIFIYNRWGEMIFHTTDPDNPWDGKFRGVDMPPDVYPYVITYTGDNDSYTKKYEKQGSITLIR